MAEREHLGGLPEDRYIFQVPAPFLYLAIRAYPDDFTSLCVFKRVN